MASALITLWQIAGENVEKCHFIFLDSKITADGDCSHEIRRLLLLARKVMNNLDSVLKGRDITLLTKVCIVKDMVFPVVMYGCESWTKESWVLKNWWFWTVVLKKTVERPLDYKDIKPLNPKGNQPWIFIVRTCAEAEAPILWPPDVKSWLTGKDPDAGKDWGQEEKETTKDETVGWHHLFNGHEFEQTLGDTEEQGSLVCCSPWGHKELDMTKQLKNNNLSLCVSLNSFWAETSRTWVSFNIEIRYVVSVKRP